MSKPEFKIEKGIPLPMKRGAPSNSAYTAAVKKMSVGDSFRAPESIRNGISQLAKKLGVILTARKIKDGEIRVWLVSKTRLPHV